MPAWRWRSNIPARIRKAARDYEKWQNEEIRKSRVEQGRKEIEEAERKKKEEAGEE